MDENKLREIVDEAVNKAVEPIKKSLAGISSQLDDPDTGLKRINERLDVNTAAIVELESTVNGYGDMYKINDSNIRKTVKRLEIVEKNAGIKVLPEFHIDSFFKAA